MSSAQKSTSLTKGSNQKSKQSPTKQNTSKKKQKIIEEVKQYSTVVKLGICAMKKKVESKPMTEIIKRLKCQHIQIILMWNCLNQDYKTWPRVDALICFYSDGFPYLKAWKYVKKYRPFLINNLEKQEYLWDRTVVYDILKKIRIPVAKHYMVFRDLNYIKEIEAKAFVQEEVIGQQPYTQLQPTKLENKKSSICYEQKQSQEKRDKDSNNKSQNQKTGLRKLSLNPYNSTRSKTSLPDKQQNNQDSLQLSVKKSIQRDLGNDMRPNTLRKFHQERLSRIQRYQVEEIDDYILIKTEQTTHKLKKPFVEKPFDSQNHQICIYYPESMGGGRKMLFRKEKNSSSNYQQGENQIRRDGNYIYEEFLPTNAFDIKVYSIGCYYMYAEARKSPTLDGVVQRDSHGKEKRFPIILTPQEKFIAKKVVQQFGQEVCGFDLLRANGKSYVCDVNGWSFVKSNLKYWDDCAIILRRKIFTHFFPQLAKQQNKIYERFRINLENVYKPPIFYLATKKQQLRSIVSIFRHGDRSPKQKLKFKTKQPKFLAYFNANNLGNSDEIKIKDAKSLTIFLQVTNDVISDSLELKNSDLTILCQIKAVLQSGGHFQGLNRKCQIKVEKRDSEGVLQKIQIVLKWGGELSVNGAHDAHELGTRMRIEKYNDQNDFISLHSSYRHDLKTYSSDQGRCIKTAASFLKGFLNIQGGLAPIITTLVKSNNKAQVLLDCTSQQNHSALNQKIVTALCDMLNSDTPLLESYVKYTNQQKISDQMIMIIKQIDRPRQKLQKMHENIITLTLILQAIEIEKIYSDSERNSRQSGVSGEQEYDFLISRSKEQVVLIYKRWSKLQKDFYSSKNQKFNISKIPEIYDTIRHDLMKNTYIFENIDFDTASFAHTAKLFAYFVVPNQYGITEQQKIKTAQEIVSPLLQKIRVDLNFWKQRNYQELYWKYTNQNQQESWKHIRTRLYFTSASHMYSVLHLMTLGNDGELLKQVSPQNVENIKKYMYMSYLSHIQFRLYETLTCADNDPNRFRVQISISPYYSKNQTIKQISFGKTGFTIDKITNYLTSVVKKNKTLYDKKYMSVQQNTSIP